MQTALWDTDIYRQTTATILGCLILVALIIAPLRKKYPVFLPAWVSLQSWFFAAPVILIFLGLKEPWPLIALTCTSILGIKEFFQITGMYHKNIFVWTAYIGVIALSYCVHSGFNTLYNIMPMLFLGTLTFIPLIQNEFKNVLQFWALSLFNFIFFGWAFLHMACILQWEYGPLHIIYITLLSEFSDNAALATGRLFGKWKFLDKISPRRTVEGLFVSCTLTLGLALLLGPMIPGSNSTHWYVAGAIGFMAGSMGDLVLTVIRRDLGLKEFGAFILGKGGVLSLIDRAIFVAPIYYYVMTYLKSLNL